MIVGGTSHSGRGLGKYLTEEDNDRAVVWDIRGSVFPELTEAVKDWRTDRLGTKTDKPLYHAWLAPSDTDRALTREEWDKAIALFEKEMGLEGQPRAVVYHEGQEGRETGHIHLVYSRIKDGKAISDSWDYLHHQKSRAEMEKAFGLAHVYAPLLDKDEPRRAQSIDEDAKEQGKRTKIDPRIVKAEVAEIYRHADSGRAFVAGIEEAGYILAQGKQRAYIIVDQAGGAHSLSRILNGTAKAKEFRDRLNEYPPHQLPDDKAAREIQYDRAQGRTTARDEITAATLEPETREPVEDAPDLKAIAGNTDSHPYDGASQESQDPPSNTRDQGKAKPLRVHNPVTGNADLLTRHAEELLRDGKAIPSPRKFTSLELQDSRAARQEHHAQKNAERERKKALDRIKAALRHPDKALSSEDVGRLWHEDLEAIQAKGDEHLRTIVKELTMSYGLKR